MTRRFEVDGPLSVDPEPDSVVRENVRATSISRGELYEMMWQHPLGVAAKKLGISSGSLAKLCDRMLVPYPSSRHWSLDVDEHAAKRTALPEMPDGMSDQISFPAEGQAKSRRTRTRMSREARRNQIADAAITIIAKAGINAATMKRIAREIGLSEGQVYNYFPSRTELLLHIARQELAEMSAIQQADIRMGRDPLSRLTLATVSYLRQVGTRGRLVQMLLSQPDVRQGLRAAHQDERINANYATALQMEELGVSKDIAFDASLILTSLSLRTGRTIAAKKLLLVSAERIALSIILESVRDLAQASRVKTSSHQGS
jgi:AcrR family transcriptional regulator